MNIRFNYIYHLIGDRQIIEIVNWKYNLSVYATADSFEKAEKKAKKKFIKKCRKVKKNE